MNQLSTTLLPAATPLQLHIASVFAGDTSPSHTNPQLPAVLDELRAINRNPQALELLGRFVLTQVTARMHADLHASKAMLRAQEDPDAN